jgi:hypothetical protein
LLVKASSTKTMLTQQFRKAVYQSMRKRADAIVDLVDALTVAGHVDSPVALSEETPFLRKFSSIFDTLIRYNLLYQKYCEIIVSYKRR